MRRNFRDNGADLGSRGRIFRDNGVDLGSHGRVFVIMARILAAAGVFFGWVLAKPIGRIKIPIARRMADGAELYRYCGFELMREEIIPKAPSSAIVR